MSYLSQLGCQLPSWQQSIRDKCVHPTGTFIEFKKEDIEGSIPNRFEQQVRAYPDQLAVKTRKHQLTYDELNKAANRVAQAILAQCGEGEEPIALLFEHGAPVIAAIFGVLKAGKFDVPLDASYPRARLAYMLKDSQARLILTNRQNRALAEELADGTLQLINFDELDFNVSNENPGVLIPPEAYAYILYTSGSTGQPNGVIENHLDVLHFTRISTNSLRICAEDRLSLFASCSFSASASAIFPALLNGATLFPFDVKEEGVGNLACWLIQEGITIYNSVPTLFRNFASTLTGEEKFPKLRFIKLGGDRMNITDVELYKKHFAPSCILRNGLGASEVKIFRQYLIDKHTQITGSVVPVGYGVDEDIEVLLLDDEAGR